MSLLSVAHDSKTTVASLNGEVTLKMLGKVNLIPLVVIRNCGLTFKIILSYIFPENFIEI